MIQFTYMKNDSKIKYICGIDEVGRGPVAGPVTVGLVLYKKEIEAEDGIFSDMPLLDSKKLSEKKRVEIVKKMRVWEREEKIFFTTASVTAKEIDKMGISLSIKKCIQTVLSKIAISPEEIIVLLDGGLFAGDKFPNQETIIKGDTKERSIALASIVAKVTRDYHMEKQAEVYPEYGFEKHKGYGTKQHYEALRAHGISPIHRVSYLSRL
ncbi:MAG: ribonuclease HII [Candidatus Paceibacteria bacterium]|jgi:ribonuclease HII